MDDQDFHSKQRIKKWIEENCKDLYGDYSGEVDRDDIADLLLEFEKFLEQCEAERQKQ